MKNNSRNFRREVKLNPIYENKPDHQERIKSVQNLLVHIVNLKKIKGRPKNLKKEDVYAA